MSISFTCPSCARSYTVDDKLAGKRVRCKQCGSAIPIPVGAPALGPNDLYGLGEIEEAMRARPDPEPVVEPVRPGPKRAGQGTSRFWKARDRSDGGNLTFRKAALSIFGFGVVAYVLPFFGLVLKPRGAAQGLDPEAQQQIGIVVAVIGAILTAFAYGMDGARSVLGEERAETFRIWTRRIFWGVAGLILFLFIGLPLLFLVGRRLFPKPAPPPVAFHAPAHPIGPRPAVAADVPQHGIEDPARPNGMPRMFPGAGGEPLAGRRGFGPSAPGAEDRQAESPTPVVLTNGVISPWERPDGSPQPGLTFRLEYQVEGNLRPGFHRYFWVIASGDRERKLPILPHLRNGQGNFRGIIPNLSREEGPFQLHVEVQSFGPGGPSEQVVSNTIPLEWAE